jgi:hypothetical protein
VNPSVVRVKVERNTSCIAATAAHAPKKTNTTVPPIRPPGAAKTTRTPRIAKIAPARRRTAHLWRGTEHGAKKQTLIEHWDGTSWASTGIVCVGMSLQAQAPAARLPSQLSMLWRRTRLYERLTAANDCVVRCRFVFGRPRLRTWTHSARLTVLDDETHDPWSLSLPHALEDGL